MTDKSDILKEIWEHSPQIISIIFSVYQGRWEDVTGKSIDAICAETGLNKQDAEVLKDIASAIIFLIGNRKVNCFNKNYVCEYKDIKTDGCEVYKSLGDKFTLGDIYNCKWRRGVVVPVKKPKKEKKLTDSD